MSEPWEKFITIEQARSLYLEGIRRYGGDASEPMPGCLEKSLGGAWNAEEYLGTIDGRLAGLVFAGHLLYYIAENNCYTDGNKRLSWTTCAHVLLHFGLTIDATTKEAEEMVKGVVTSDSSNAMQVVDWLAEHIVAVTPVLDGNFDAIQPSIEPTVDQALNSRPVPSADEEEPINADAPERPASEEAKAR